MPKHNCLFQVRWLEDERFKDRLGKNDTVLICNYCSIVVNMEEAALTSHIKGKEHVERFPSEQCIKSLMPPTPAPPSIILKKFLGFRFSNSKLSPLIILKISFSGVWSFQ